MNQAELSRRNRKAWTFKTVDAWQKLYGSPSDVVKEILRDPRKQLWRTISYLGDVKGKRIINLLGSHGRKAVPLALLGAQVTVVDISEKNKDYALFLAEAAGVEITYIVSDVLSLNTDSLRDTFDIVFMENGILHYFLDLMPLTKLVYDLLMAKGQLILNEAHPIKKCIQMNDERPFLEGDYFDSKISESPVAYEFAFEEEEKKGFAKCLLRRWTLGEIITTIAQANLVIEQLIEDPGPHKDLPGYFTLVASKLR